jgi:hypothetical protein
MEPKNFADSKGLVFIEEVSEKGVFFAKFKRNGNDVYYPLQDGYVVEPELEDIGHVGNTTYGVIDGQRYMVDDEPPFVHEDEPL